MAIIFIISFLIIAPIVLFSDVRSTLWEDDSRIINARGLSSEDRFHLISRWGAQN